MRSNNPLLDGAQDVSPSLDIEAAVPAIPTLTGTAKPRQKPPKYSDIYKINGKSGSSGSVSSTNTSSLSNPPEYSSKVIFDYFFRKDIIGIKMIFASLLQAFYLNSVLYSF